MIALCVSILLGCFALFVCLRKSKAANRPAPPAGAVTRRKAAVRSGGDDGGKQTGIRHGALLARHRAGASREVHVVIGTALPRWAISPVAGLCKRIVLGIEIDQAIDFPSRPVVQLGVGNLANGRMPRFTPAASNDGQKTCRREQ